MVIACVAIPEERIDFLKGLGVKDSKLLSPSQREDIFKSLEHSVKHEIVIIQPSEIDEAVNSQTTNLNWLEADKAADILNKIDAKLDNDVKKAIVDCPSNNLLAYKAYFIDKMDSREIELVVEHKADLNHLVVGAASIMAKVTRDREIEKIKRKYKIETGSGYPSDPSTQKFLKENWNSKVFSKYIRKSWATYKALADMGKQKTMGEFDP